MSVKYACQQFWYLVIPMHVTASSPSHLWIYSI